MQNIIYVVTGAAGFLGSNICRYLAQRGDKVRALVLPNEPFHLAKRAEPNSFELCRDEKRCLEKKPGKDNIDDEVTLFEGNVCDKKSLEPLFATSENERLVVIHCASIVTVNPEFSTKVWDVNVNGTRNILELCQETLRFEKLVYVSSTGCIPAQPRGTKIREVHTFFPENFSDCYSQTKAAATQAVLEAAHLGMNACVVHPTGIMGPYDYAVGVTTKMMASLIKGEMKAAISGTFNLADVRDLAAGTVAAADKGRSGHCYILGNEAVSFKQFSQFVELECHTQGIPAQCARFFIPGRLAMWMAKRMEKKAAKRGEKPKMTVFAVYNLIRNNVFDSSKAKKELGYHTRPFTETIHDQIKWMKSAGII